MNNDWPQAGDVVYVAEYGHGARKGKYIGKVDTLHRVEIDEQTCARGVLNVYRTANEAEKSLK